MDLNKIYAKEKIINSYFAEKYDYKNEEIFNKQVLQLLCEVTIPEFADCLMITLCFCDLANIDILEIEEIKEKNMVKMFIEANKLASTLTINLDKDKLLKILSYLIAISNLLGYSDEELDTYCAEKMDKTLKMVRK